MKKNKDTQVHIHVTLTLTQARRHVCLTTPGSGKEVENKDAGILLAGLQVGGAAVETKSSVSSDI